MTRCGYCQDTGFRTRGMVISPRFQDDYVDYVVNLVACSHPETPQDGPGVTDETGPVAAASGGSGLVERLAGGSNPKGAPASLDEQRRAHDERVKADAAAYEASSAIAIASRLDDASSSRLGFVRKRTAEDGAA